jgi:kynurenine formamidase
VDVPYHFFAEGRTIDAYLPDIWIFTAPQVVDVPIEKGELIGSLLLPVLNEKTDILLIRSGFEKFRDSDVYCRCGPGLMRELANFLFEQYPVLRAVGIDFISISSFQHREEGRSAHKAFLEREILLFEDLSLVGIDDKDQLKKVIALPLRIKGGDGAPCTVIGFLE